MARLSLLGVALFVVSCGPPKSNIPSLNPQQAAQLLHYNNRAQTWLTTVRRQDPTCDYKIELPDQTSHPKVIDLPHVVQCNGRPAPKALDATMTFSYDSNKQTWVLSRFAS